MAEPDLAKRMLEMEERYTHLERFVAELSDVVASQQQTVDNLHAVVTRLRAQLLNAGESDAAGHERPPHY